MCIIASCNNEKIRYEVILWLQQMLSEELVTNGCLKKLKP